MNRTMSNTIHPRFYPHLWRPRHPGRGGDVIRLRRRRHSSAAPVIGYTVIALLASTLIVATLALAARSAQDIFGQLLPAWPWWW